MRDTRWQTYRRRNRPSKWLRMKNERDEITDYFRWVIQFRYNANGYLEYPVSSLSSPQFALVSEILTHARGGVSFSVFYSL